jgi:hypothetical protein
VLAFVVVLVLDLWSLLVDSGLGEGQRPKNGVANWIDLLFSKGIENDHEHEHV